MGRILFFTSGKGGTGKSIVCANLANCMMHQGNNVLLIDADFGYRSLDIFLGLEDRTFSNLLDVLKGTKTLDQAIVSYQNQQLQLLAAPVMAEWTEVLAKAFANLLMEMKERYDVIIVDCPARMPDCLLDTLYVADEIYLVLTPEVASFRAAEHVKAQFLQRRLRRTSALINMFDLGMVAEGGRMGIDDIEDLLALEVIGVIPLDHTISKCANLGRLVYNEEKRWDSSMAFERIAKRLMGEDIPFGFDLM